MESADPASMPVKGSPKEPSGEMKMGSVMKEGKA